MGDDPAELFQDPLGTRALSVPPRPKQKGRVIPEPTDDPRAIVIIHKVVGQLENERVILVDAGGNDGLGFPLRPIERSALCVSHFRPLGSRSPRWFIVAVLSWCGCVRLFQNGCFQ